MDNQQQNTEQNSPTEPRTTDIPTPTMPDAPQSFLGPLIGILIAVAILALGLLYLWQPTYTDENADGGGQTEPRGDTAQGNAQPTAAPSSPEDLSDIEADLDANLSGLEDDLSGVDEALQETP